MTKFCSNKSCKKLNINPLNKYCSQNCLTMSGGNMWGSQRKPIKKVSDKKIQRKLEHWTESALFIKKVKAELQEKWILICMNPDCKKVLSEDELWPPSFPHLLSKGMYPQYRYFLNNLWIVCNSIAMSSCHTKVDEILSGHKLELEEVILSGNRVNIEDFIEKDFQ